MIARIPNTEERKDNAINATKMKKEEKVKKHIMASVIIIRKERQV